LRSAGDDDGGDLETLLVWTSKGMGMNKITSLQEISQGLPYGHYPSIPTLFFLNF